MKKTVINYSSRDFLTALNEINEDPDLARIPENVKRLVCGQFDALNNSLNVVANALMTRTMFERTHAEYPLGMIGYSLEWKRTSYADLEITVDPSTTSGGEYTVPVEDLRFSTEGTPGENPMVWEAREPVTLTASTTSTAVRVWQQETRLETEIGVAGGESWQEYRIFEADVIKETLVVTVDGVLATLVKNLAHSEENHLHYTIHFQGDGTSYVKFGGLNKMTDVQFGAIPIKGASIKAAYAVGGGAGTVIGPNRINLYTGPALILTATNHQASKEGRDEETLENAREASILDLKTNDNHWTAADARSVAIGVAGVQAAHAVKSGEFAINLTIMPDGGGSPTTELLETVKLEAEKRGPLKEVSVTVNGVYYVRQSIIGQVRVLPSYTFDSMKHFCELAILLRLHESGEYIRTKYGEEGISATITRMNATFAAYLSRPIDSVRDQDQVRRFMENIPFQTFSETAHPEDAISAVQGFVQGVDVFRLSQPTSSVLVSNGQIFSPSQVLVTEFL